MQQKQLLFSIVLMAIAIWLPAQNRTFDGIGNNPNHPEWGAANTPLLRYTTVSYEDRVSLPAGSNRPNPREISNVIFQQDSLLDDPRGLSAITWVWGQFIDHDIGLTSDNHSEPVMISVPSGDELMDPNNTGNAIIPLMRSVGMDGTGTSANYPREHPNEITSFIDASNVYGSDEVRADWLRSHINGKLKLPNNLLPFNTYDGGIGSTIDPESPSMANPFGAELYFVAGDIRASENILLTSFHTLFAREHNRQCDLLKSLYPDWSDEELYQYARKIVGGIEQSITYNEWMPMMGIILPEYTGFNPNVNPSVMNVFTGAAYRQGHTLLTDIIYRLDEEGNEIPEGNTNLKHAFFNPMAIYNEGGIDPLLRGIAAQVQQDLDAKMIEDVRSFLFGAPGQGGMDLAAINIQRGRERGLPDFNTLREDFGLQKYTSFSDLTSDSALANSLENLYGNINDIDAWVGLLAEENKPGKMFGQTLVKIMYDQFLSLRDGDRFYYENDPVLSDDVKTEIRNTKLIDVIMRNTNIELMQGSPFQAMTHDELEDCGATTPYVNIDVNIQNVNGSNIPGVTLNIEGYSLLNDGVTDENGNGYFTSVPVCKDYSIEPSKVESAQIGISVSDVITMAGHVLGTAPITNPYLLLAADANLDNKIDVRDIIKIRRVLLLIDDNFGDVPVWNFANSDFSFQDDTNPFLERDFPSSFETQMINEDKLASFIGYKLGDVNGSHTGGIKGNTSGRTAEIFTISAENKSVSQDELVTIQFEANALNTIKGFQFTLNYDLELLELVNVEDGIVKNEHYAVFENEGAITMVWNKMNDHIESSNLFGLTFKALRNVTISDAININSRKIDKEAVNNDMELMNVDLMLKNGDSIAEASDVFDLYQNSPNPFTEFTMVGFNLPEGSDVTLTVSNSTGSIISKSTTHFEGGYNEIKISDLSTGVYFYEILSDFGTKTKSFIVIE